MKKTNLFWVASTLLLFTPQAFAASHSVIPSREMKELAQELKQDKALAHRFCEDNKLKDMFDDESAEAQNTALMNLFGNFGKVWHEELPLELPVSSPKHEHGMKNLMSLKLKYQSPDCMAAGMKVADTLDRISDLKRAVSESLAQKSRGVYGGQMDKNSSREESGNALVKNTVQISP